jgi:hypothetical protein
VVEQGSWSWSYCRRLDHALELNVVCTLL